MPLLPLNWPVPAPTPPPGPSTIPLRRCARGRGADRKTTHVCATAWGRLLRRQMTSEWPRELMLNAGTPAALASPTPA
eukprot:1817159-Pyramimonas_sp.AAC.2